MNGPEGEAARHGSPTRLSRGTRAALMATPALILIGWLSASIFGMQVTLPRALCAIVALGFSEAVIEEGRLSLLERELVTFALGLAMSVALAAVLDLFFHGAV